MRNMKSTTERDAERYRWLRSKDLETIAKGGVFAGNTPENVVVNGADLDQMIDAEMRLNEDPLSLQSVMAMAPQLFGR